MGEVAGRAGGGGRRAPREGAPEARERGDASPDSSTSTGCLGPAARRNENFTLDKSKTTCGPWK